MLASSVLIDYHHETMVKATLLLAICAATSFGSEIDVVLEPTDTLIKEASQSIGEWRSAAFYYKAISFLVALLALAPLASRVFVRKAADQSSKEDKDHQEVRLFGTFNLLAGIGLLTAILSLFVTWGFDADHHAYTRAADRAGGIIVDIKQKIAQLRINPDSQDPLKLLALYSQLIEPRYNALAAVKPIPPVEDVKVPASASLFWMPARVYAQMGKTDARASATAEANFEWQAQQNSKTAAVEAMVAILENSFGRQATVLEKEALRGYAQAYGRQSQSKAGSGAKGVRIRTDLTLNAAYLNATLIAAYMKKTSGGAQGSKEQQIASLRSATGNGKLGGDDGYVEGLGVVTAKGGSIMVRKTNPKDGDFTFHFSAVPGAGGRAEVRLTSMDIRQDSSGGSTRWSFYVLSEGRIVMTLPEQRWDDWNGKSVCWWENVPWLTANLPLSGGSAPITVVGIKPKLQDKL